MNSPLGALSSAADVVGRVVRRCHDTLASCPGASDPALAGATEALGSVQALCSVIDESSRRLADVVSGLDRLLGPAWGDAPGLDELERALMLVEHQGRMRLSAASGAPRSGARA
jgi:predicted trehalose synthase